MRIAFRAIAPIPLMAPTTNRVRIIGGRHRGRLLRFPGVPGLRPTPDRVRETLFNWLGQDLAGRTTPITAETIDLENPDSSITLPNTAPSRKTGK